MADTKKIALAMVEASTDLRADIAAMTFTVMPQDLMKLLPVIQKGAIKVEEYAAQAGGLTGPEKKEVLVKFLDELIKLPLWAEPFDGPAIGWMIDYVIIGLNKVLGKSWSPFSEDPK